MKIAVTGAHGRVGAAVVATALADGHDVVRVDRVGPTDDGSLHIDVQDYDSVVRGFHGCDAVIHLAAIPGPGALPDHIVHNNNVVASYNVLRAAVENGIARVCLASSINAIGGRFSRVPRYDFFPIDESHPSYAEDPYSLSKSICEQQADACARANPGMSIASLRPHAITDDPAELQRWVGSPQRILERHLWGWVRRSETARAFLLSVTTDLGGHEVFNIVAPETMVDAPSRELAAEHYPDVPIRNELAGHVGFYDCSKAARLLGWIHDGETS